MVQQSKRFKLRVLHSQTSTSTTKTLYLVLASNGGKKHKNEQMNKLSFFLITQMIGNLINNEHPLLQPKHKKAIFFFFLFSYERANPFYRVKRSREKVYTQPWDGREMTMVQVVNSEQSFSGIRCFVFFGLWETTNDANKMRNSSFYIFFFGGFIKFKWRESRKIMDWFPFS